MDASRALLWIVLLPLVGAVMNGLFGRFASRQTVSVVGVGTVAASFLLSLVGFAELASGGGSGRLVYDAYEWFSVTIHGADVPVQVRFVMDSLSGVMALVVTGVGLVIHVYSLGYMHEDPSYARFFSYLNLFMASMLILVLASSLPVMFVGWEGVGLCSYLLIGFWWEHTDYAKAGRKAFVMNRLGDFGVLLAMFLLVKTVGSFEFAEINDAASGLTVSTFTFGTLELGSVATVACLFLFLGCTGKSAQIPLYTWLPDAMAGPTPVSALIHAATMVTSGVYLCARLSDLFLASPTAMAVIALIGAATALLAASIALVQDQIKKILAYSTVSQLGFMFAAVGSGAFAAGIFHVYTHAFFKACLFLGAGSVMHAVGAHGDADIRKLGGLRRYLPETHWTFLASCLAIAGFPLMSGFFSKDMILMGAAKAGEAGYHGASWVGWLTYGILVVAAVLTAFYMFRLYFRTFAGSYRSAPAEGEEEGAGAQAGEHGYETHPHESEKVMTVPLMILGVGAIVAGFVNLEALGVHIDPWGKWLASSVAGLEAEAHMAHMAASAGGLAAVALGIGLAWALYGRRADDPLPSLLPSGLYRLMADKWRVDELYDALFVRPVQMLAILAGWVDKTFVDGLLTQLTAGVARGFGWLVSRLQTGLVYMHGAALVAGAVVVGWWFMYPHVQVESTTEGSQVTWEAARGLGYEYRWDATADGEPETEWSAEGHTFAHSYGVQDAEALELVVGPGPRQRPERLRLHEGEPVPLDPGMLAPRWRAPGRDPVPPVVSVERGQVRIRPNGARLRGGTPSDESNEVMLQAGDSARLGGMNVHVEAVVRAEVHVRNAFGYTSSDTVEAAIRPGSGGSQQVALRENER